MGEKRERQSGFLLARPFRFRRSLRRFLELRSFGGWQRGSEPPPIYAVNQAGCLATSAANHQLCSLATPWKAAVFKIRTGRRGFLTGESRNTFHCFKCC
jgi:hypothetical protein